MTTADRVFAVVLAVVLAAIVVAAAFNASSAPAPEEPEVPTVVVREITTPDGVQHMCAITMDGGISCDWLDHPEDVPVRVWTPDGHTLTHLTNDGRRRPA